MAQSAVYTTWKAKHGTPRTTQNDPRNALTVLMYESRVKKHFQTALVKVARHNFVPTKCIHSIGYITAESTKADIHMSTLRARLSR